MSNCKNCGAALPPDSIICTYCNTRVDIDLGDVNRYTIETPESERICPRCNIPLQTIDINFGDKFLIERCSSCMGLFFDLNELETLVDKSVANVYQIDYSRLGEIHQLKRHSDYPVTYIKCPVCRKLMNRLNFGFHSGVIIDKCKDHGIWLDGGELRQILEWTKAGGQIINERKQLEMERLKLQEERDKLRFQQGPLDGSSQFSNEKGFTISPYSHSESEIDLSDMFSRMNKFLSRFFK